MAPTFTLFIDGAENHRLGQQNFSQLILKAFCLFAVYTLAQGYLNGGYLCFFSIFGIIP